MNLDQNRVFIFGGTTLAAYNRSEIFLDHSEDAFIWHEYNSTWTMIKSKSPCPQMAQPVVFPLQCVTRIVGEAIEVIVISSNDDGEICTSALNIDTLQWIEIDGNLPFGGFLLTGNDQCKVYYVGGIQQDSVFELSLNNEWRQIEAKLPFPMAMNDTYFTLSQLNVTECASDSSIRYIYINN